MANLSEAGGSFLFPAKLLKNEQMLNIIKKIFEETATWEYATYLEEINKQEIEEVSQDDNIEVGFSGFGRWSYSNNLNNFDRSLKREELLPLYKFMHDENLEIGVEFKDIEFGNCFLYEEFGKLKVVKSSFKENDEYSLEYEVVNHEDFDFTAQNIKFHFGGDYECVYDKTIDSLKEFLENESEEAVSVVQRKIGVASLEIMHLKWQKILGNESVFVYLDDLLEYFG